MICPLNAVPRVYLRPGMLSIEAAFVTPFQKVTKPPEDHHSPCHLPLAGLSCPLQRSAACFLSRPVHKPCPIDYPALLNSLKPLQGGLSYITETAIIRGAQGPCTSCEETGDGRRPRNLSSAISQRHAATTCTGMEAVHSNATIWRR